MSFYVLLNWIICLCTSVFLLIVIFRYRFLLIKPSVIIVVFFHLRIQWAATLQAFRIENYLPQPYSFFLLVQIFPLLGLIGSFFIFHKKAQTIYFRISSKSTSSLLIENGIVYILVAVFLVITVYYFFHVPFSKTGLYAVFFNPSEAAHAREASLKLIENPLLRYSYSFLKNAFAPILAVILTFFILQKYREKIFQTSMALVMLIFVFFVASLTGARSPAAALILTIAWAFYLLKGMPFRPVYLLIIFLLVLTPPVLISLLREGQNINISIFLNYLKGGIFYRVFIMPMQVGLYHVYHAQANGFFGIAAVPKLAAVFGIQPINVANFIYVKYLRFSFTLPSGLANTSYVFSYYSYFGILSVIFSIFGLWALDLSVLIFKKIKNDLILLSCIASIFVVSIAFISVDYTIALLTNGFLIILFGSWFLDRINELILNTRQRENIL